MEGNTIVYTSEDVAYVKSNINSPFCTCRISTLGGVEHNSLLINLSLDDRNKWYNGIFENSRFMKVYVDEKLVVEQIIHSYETNRLRKKRCKSIKDVVEYINTWIANENSSLEKPEFKTGTDAIRENVEDISKQANRTIETNTDKKINHMLHTGRLDDAYYLIRVNKLNPSNFEESAKHSVKRAIELGYPAWAANVMGYFDLNPAEFGLDDLGRPLDKQANKVFEEDSYADTGKGVWALDKESSKLKREEEKIKKILTQGSVYTKGDKIRVHTLFGLRDATINEILPDYKYAVTFNDNKETSSVDEEAID